MLFYFICAIALIETAVLYRMMVWRRRLQRAFAESEFLLNTSLMRLTFASQLIIELLTGSKAIGGFSSFGLGLLAGFLAMRSVNLVSLSELLMNVFMGISMGIFLIGHLPTMITFLLITPVFLSSGMTFIHTVLVDRK